MHTMKKYQERIGDGKTPNIYYVFHYDEKMTKNSEGELEFRDTDDKVDGGYLGQFKSYQKALECVDNKAYLPHVVIEDRISGVVFESYCVVCGCCGNETWETQNDIGFTKKTLGLNFK
jgi:hypothetical protein